MVRIEPTPEQFLGLAVIGPAGDRIGTVVDVGLYNWRQPKFLLVKPESGEAPRLLRVDIGEVAGVVEGRVRLAPRPAGALPGGSLPA